jgi:hypothetical protein
MNRTRPQLFIPVRDRRQSKRYLTLRNAGKAAVVVFALLAIVTIQASLRRSKPGEYGRLLGEQVPREPAVVERKVDVVREAPVTDNTAADPLLVAPAAREQFLGTPPPATTSAAAVPTAAPTPPVRGDGSVTIVGGAEGVSVVRADDRKQPPLTGGIFKEH